MTARAIKKQKQNLNKDKPETRKTFSRLISYIQKRSLTEYNSRNKWCNFSDYFIGNLRFPFLMFQTHNPYYKSKELDTNNCVESWE